MILSPIPLLEILYLKIFPLDSCMYIMLGASMVYFFDVVNYWQSHQNNQRHSRETILPKQIIVYRLFCPVDSTVEKRRFECIQIVDMKNFIQEMFQIVLEGGRQICNIGEKKKQNKRSEGTDYLHIFHDFF